MLVTALVTPFTKGGAALDTDVFARLVRFQLDQGCDQVLIGSTTGEVASLDEDERLQLLDAALSTASPDQIMLAIGPGRREQVIARGRAALGRGVRDLLLVDAPYAGASSAALRTSWYGPVAEELAEARLWPYAFPARTGTELLPDDLAILRHEHANVVGVKDSTGRLARMERLRELCGPDFTILCGDAGLLRDAMIDPHIRADGAVVALGNLVPAGLRELHDACTELAAARARELHDSLTMVFGLGCVTTEERVRLGEHELLVPQRVLSPVPLKAALGLLGVCRPDVRPPLGPLGPNGSARVRTALRLTRQQAPPLLAPLAEAFSIDLGEMLDSGPELAHSMS